jgi:DNA-binding CsgD family transcriptional regulator
LADAARRGQAPAGGAPDGRAAAEEPQPGGRLATLTAREREVLGLLSSGASTKAIADQLGITPWTVKRHLTNLYRKLSATNRVDAVRCYLLAEHDAPDPDDPH